MRLRRFFVAGLPVGTSTLVTEFLLFHGVGHTQAIDRPDLEKIEIVCFYHKKKKEGS
jgi:hypothetical protein